MNAQRSQCTSNIIYTACIRRFEFCNYYISCITPAHPFAGRIPPAAVYAKDVARSHTPAPAHLNDAHIAASTTMYPIFRVMHVLGKSRRTQTFSHSSSSSSESHQTLVRLTWVLGPGGSAVVKRSSLCPIRAVVVVIDVVCVVAALCPIRMPVYTITVLLMHDALTQMHTCEQRISDSN